MTMDDHIVFIVDDDARIREALTELLGGAWDTCCRLWLGRRVCTGRKAGLAGMSHPRCGVAGHQRPGSPEADRRRSHPPIVFITGHGDIPSSVRAIKRGAVDFLTKPFSDDDLLNAVQTGLAQDREARLERAEMAALLERYAALTPRERDVLPLVVSGLLNKQAAAELGISEVTLQIHRRNVLQKMAAASLADLVRMAEKLQIPITHSRRGPES